MGIEKPIIDYEKQVLQSLGLKYKGLKWCELGNQRINDNEIAKRFYQSLGVEHISIDLNGEDEALPIDLDKPMPFILLNQFDVITNYGTIEHVNNQYQVFTNVHDMCKKGGLVNHIFPPRGHWPGHCRYYYSEDFVRGLAKACDYHIAGFMILDKDEYIAPKNLIAVSFIKKENNSFISREIFEHINGITDSGDMNSTGDYTKADYIALISAIKKLPLPIRNCGKRILKFLKK
jgi:hypothetical protein